MARSTRKQVKSSSINVIGLLGNPFIRPIVEYAAWVFGFWLASQLHQQPIYYLALIVVFLIDVQNASEHRKGLLRDFVAACMTSLLGWVFKDTLSWGLGLVVAIIAAVTLAWPIIEAIDRWLNP